jgi:hypothetical protein
MSLLLGKLVVPYSYVLESKNDFVGLVSCEFVLTLGVMAKNF